MVSRAKDWMRQANKDLRHAERSLEFGDYEWACFAAQQAAEKAVKALYESRNMEVWGIRSLGCSRPFPRTSGLTSS
jgi:HEPN domain-containing protein